MHRADAQPRGLCISLLQFARPELRQAWETRTQVEWEEGILSVVSPEGLIFLKSLRRSGQEQDDIGYLRTIIDED
jgi:hypothetical protein